MAVKKKTLTAAQRKRSAAAKRGWETRRIIAAMYEDFLKLAGGAKNKARRRAVGGATPAKRRPSRTDFDEPDFGTWEIEVTGDIDTL